jgi:hypothetical protein
MAEVKNSFLKSKMNKDLDSRLVPNGEYRDAVNVQVIKSEGEDVGALENAQGNYNAGDFQDFVNDNFSDVGSLVSVGYFVDQTNSDVYLFFTDNNSLKYNPSASNFIFKWSDEQGIKLLAHGAFLNFHPQFPIIGVNLLERLLFFTDNRNQPRKINVDKALNDSTYYSTEDQISVAKYNPYKAIEVYTPSTVQLEFNSAPVTVTTDGSVTNNINVTVASIPLDGNSDPLIVPGLSIVSTTYTENELNQVIVTNVNESEKIITFNQPVTLDDGVVLSFYYIQTSMVDAVSTTLPDDTTANPFLDPLFPGDPNFLEDKFVKFSYRFKFDDGEYSILAPFTQACFIPKQDGYFLSGDEEQTFASTVVSFAKNKVNKINLQVPLPDKAENIANSYKISEVDILYKESDALAVQVVETIDVSKISEESKASKYFNFTYVSTKPYKTLPESEITRVYDKVPVKAFSQEVSSNRIIYGNFQDKHTPPTGLSYQVSAGRKLNVYDIGSNFGTVEYPSSNVKENRNYQVGVVLSDKFGRQSTVILSNERVENQSQGFKADTVYLPYSSEDTNDSEYMWNFLGNSLKVQFNSLIPGKSSPEKDGEPGLYNGDATSEDYNPLGWYSYKIVVKQVEQDYYNVYSSGAMKGTPYYTGTATATNPEAQNSSFITLLNDNINKVPRDLSEVGPQDKTFRSSVRLFGRVMNNTNTYSVDGNEQFSQANDSSPGRSEFTTNTIEDLFDLFDVDDYDPQQPTPITSPNNPFYAFYKSESNPFIAEFITSQNSDFQFGTINLQTVTNPSTTFEKFENLAILETAPTTSRLDIYWETTSSGLIDDLNTVIDQGVDGAAKIRNFDFYCPEDILPGEDLINNPNKEFYFLDKNDNEILPTSVTLKAYDKAGNDLANGVTQKLEVMQSGNKFKLKVSEDAYFYYEADTNNQTNPLNLFEFQFVVETAGSIESIIVPIETSDFPFQVTNRPPYIDLPGDRSIARSYTATTLLTLTENFNGSADPSRQREGLTWSISNIQGPSEQNYVTEFRISTTAAKPANSKVNIYQAAKTSSNRVTREEAQPNFGTYTYDVTVTDAGGLSTTETITQHICIPSLVDYMSYVTRNTFREGDDNFKRLYQGDGAVEFFADSLTNLDSTAVIPSEFQDGYTTTGLNNETNNVVSGYVCDSDSTNDAKYYARAFKAKPIEQPSSLFYVFCDLTQSLVGRETTNTTSITTAGVYAAIEFRANSNDPWTIAQDVDGEDCVYGNLYNNKVNSEGNILLAGMTQEDPDDSVLQNKILIQNETSKTGSNKGLGAQASFAAMIARPGGRIFVLNNPGEYRIAFGNIYNNYNAFEHTGPNCSEAPDTTTNLFYEIGDFTNAPKGSALRGFDDSNIYTYEISVFIEGPSATCSTGPFVLNTNLYSASPSARYLYARNKTLIDASSSGGDVFGATITDEIFGLFTDEKLTQPLSKNKFLYPDPSEGQVAFARIRRKNSNPESTRDGTYLLVVDPAGYKNREVYIASPCLDSEDSTSSNSGNNGGKILAL